MDHISASILKITTAVSRYITDICTFAASSGDKATNSECRVDSADMNWRLKDVISGDTMFNSRKFDKSKDVVSIPRHSLLFP